MNKTVTFQGVRSHPWHRGEIGAGSSISVRLVHCACAMKQYDVSALLLFHDDEECIGTAVEHVVHCLRETVPRFELIAVDAGSRDNSVALLSVVRTRFPELRIVAAPNPRRAHQYAAEQARGEVLWFFESANAAASGSTDAFARSFEEAYRRVRAGEEDLIVASAMTSRPGPASAGLVARRSHLRRAVKGLRTHGPGLPLGLTTRARLMRMHVDTPRGRWARRLPMSRWVAPLMSALSTGWPH